MTESASSPRGTAPPELAGGWPLLGQIPGFQKDPVALLANGQREHGDLFQFRLGPRRFALFSGTAAHDFYFGEADDLLDAKSVYEFTVPIFGRGVAYDVSPEIMSEQLMFLYPALQGGAMQRFARIMYDEATLFVNKLDEEGELDLPTALNQLTVNIASHCLIGKEVRDLVDQGFAAAYHDLQAGVNTLGFFFPRLPTRAHRTRDRARREIARILGGVIERRRVSGDAPDDFMQTLANARYQDGRSLTDEEVIGILLTVLFAGQHTSAVLATWTGLELMAAPGYTSRVRDEISEIYEGNGALSHDSLKHQPLLDYAVQEGERLHPPLILLVRRVMEDLSYDGYRVGKGTLAMVSPAVAHRLPEVFEDPQRFHPDRFGPPSFEGKQHHYALIGFGGGKHRCMGRHFAYVQLKAIWTVLLDRLEFHRDGGVPASNYGSWVTGPIEPCRVQYRKRRQPAAVK